MSWKSMSSSSLADALLVEHRSIYELDSLKGLINLSPTYLNYSLKILSPFFTNK